MLTRKVLLTRGVYCLAAVALLSPSPQARAQSRDAPTPAPAEQQQAQRPANALRQLTEALNLTREQRRQIAQIRRQTEPDGRALGQRLRIARREFEEAIYADEINEGLIEERARAVAEAEAARLRLRAQTELRIRRVLTPEQWNTFRELRRRAADQVQRQSAPPTTNPWARPLRERLRERLQGQPPAAAPPRPPAAPPPARSVPPLRGEPRRVPADEKRFARAAEAPARRARP